MRGDAKHLDDGGGFAPPIDLPDRYQSVCERNRELFETVEQLRMELQRKDEIIRATSIEHIRLRAGLREALELLTGATMSTDAYDDRIADLRKLLGGESPRPDALEGREFYELMQAYRHCPMVDFEGVQRTFDAVKAFVRNGGES